MLVLAGAPMSPAALQEWNSGLVLHHFAPSLADAKNNIWTWLSSGTAKTLLPLWFFVEKDMVIQML